MIKYKFPFLAVLLIKLKIIFWFMFFYSSNSNYPVKLVYSFIHVVSALSACRPNDLIHNRLTSEAVLFSKVFVSTTKQISFTVEFFHRSWSSSYQANFLITLVCILYSTRLLPTTHAVSHSPWSYCSSATILATVIGSNGNVVG